MGYFSFLGYDEGMKKQTKVNIRVGGVCLILAVSGWLWFVYFVKTGKNIPVVENTEVIEKKINLPTKEEPPPVINIPEQVSSAKTVVMDTEKMQSVPFTSQAPRGQWSTAMFQDACEEASVLMAYAWTQGQTKLTAHEVDRDIRAMSAWEIKRFGQDVDLSPEDTAVLMREYWKWQNVSVQDGISKQDIINVLYDGAVVIVPTNGKALKNPFFTDGGPAEHMLVIIGYDPKQKQFITNDPGTKYGAGYRYDENVLYGAIRAYPTGDHLPIVGVRKAMIVVTK